MRGRPRLLRILLLQLLPAGAGVGAGPGRGCSESPVLPALGTAAESRWWPVTPAPSEGIWRSRLGPGAGAPCVPSSAALILGRSWAWLAPQPRPSCPEEHRSPKGHHQLLMRHYNHFPDEETEASDKFSVRSHPSLSG